MHICIQNGHMYDCVHKHSLMHIGRYRTPGWEGGKKEEEEKKESQLVHPNIDWHQRLEHDM